MTQKPMNYKKFVATAATATLVASALVPVASADTKATGFTDVAAQYKAAVDFLVANNITNGKTATQFGTAENISRLDSSIWIAKALLTDADFENAAASGFTDVPARGEKYINALKAKGWVNGKNDTTFDAYGDITRGAAAIILANAYGLKGDVANYEFTDVNARYADAVAALKDNGITSGKSATRFGTDDSITRGELAVWLYKADQGVEVEGVAPEITSVTAINATQAKVTFKGAVQKGVDFSNFDINGGSTITNVEFSADRKSATITANPEFVRNQEYTVSVFGVLDADGKEYAETKGKFTWEVAEGVVVALGATTLEQGETTKLTVKDAGGKDVKDAKVTVTSLNTNLVTVKHVDNVPSSVEVKANNDKLAGTTEVLVETELPDGSILNNTFKVTVKEAVTTVANAGYTLENITVDADATATAYANALSFKNYGKQVTSVVENSGEFNLVAFSETNGNPDVTHLDFEGAKVTSSNAIVATAVVGKEDNKNKIIVTPLKAGTTTIQVTLKDGSRKTFPITVTATPVITDLYVDATTVNLSDENRTETDENNTTGQDGVDAKKISVATLDQYKAPLAGGKVTVTSSTDGVKLYDVNTDQADEYTTGANVLTMTGGADSFYIQAQKDKPVSNAKVTVSYFKDVNDTKPAITKTITVNVADIDVTDLTADIDVVAANEIDANAINLGSGTNAINFSTEVYAVNSKGNRIENLSGDQATTTATLDAKNTEAAKFVAKADAVVNFKNVENALTYLRADSTVNVEVAVTEDVNTNSPSAGQTVTKIVPVAYKNTAVVPNKVTVATNPISIKLDGAGTISLDEIIFGKLDAKQLITDNVAKFDLDLNHKSHYITTLKTAKNAGYEFNKSIVSVTGTDGKSMNLGAALYGNLAEGQDEKTDGNAWTNSVIKDLTQKEDNKFVVDGFEYDFAIANVAGDVVLGDDSDSVTLAKGESSTFTLVLSGVYVAGSVEAIEEGTTAAEKAKHNLLAAPVQLNVSVSAE